MKIEQKNDTPSGIGCKKRISITNSIVVILLLFISLNANSQQEVAIDSSKLVIINVGLRGMWQTGRTSQIDIAPNLKLQLLKSNHYFEQSIEYQFLKVNNFAVVNDFWSSSLFQFKQNKKFYPFATLAGGTAKSFLLNHFIFTGAGIGSNIYRKSISEYLQIHAFIGYLDYSIDDFLHQALSVGSIIRANVGLSKNIQLNWSFTSYHSTNLISSWGLQNNAKLNFLVSENLRINLNHRLFYNNQTVNQLEKLNTILLFGVNYQFKKEKQ